MVLPGLHAHPEGGPKPSQVLHGNNGMEVASICFFPIFKEEKRYRKQNRISKSVLHSFQSI